MSTIVDPSLAQQVVRAALLAASPVTAIVGPRVTGSHAVTPDAPDPTYPLLVFAYSGGDGIRSLRLADLTYGMTVYSRVSADEALAGYHAAAQVLHAERLTLSGIAVNLVVHETARPAIGWDEGHRAHYAVGRFRVQELG
jgi:hypothetical protein